MPSKIINCICAHQTQDKLHGPQQRVANLTIKGKTDTEQNWRCSVCAREVTLSKKGTK